MPNWKAFAKIGLSVAKVMVPQIAQVESAVAGIKSGPDKKKAVMDTVSQSIELAEVLSGKEIADVPLLMQGISEMNDGYVKVMNAIKHDPEQEP